MPRIYSTSPIQIGHQQGRLTVIAQVPREKGKPLVWKCLCQCGVEKEILDCSLRRTGNTNSCGCLHREFHSKRVRTHGHAGCSTGPSKRLPTKVYRTWRGMITRCTNDKYPCWKNYGGKGITVCERWLTFENFLADMGEPPTAAHSLDRINNDGNYEPSNCRWATPKQQARNTSRNRFITFNGQSKTMAEWAEECGIGYMALRARIDYYQWPLERALTQPQAAPRRRRKRA